MRQIVVDDARRDRADKRGGNVTTVDVDAAPAAFAPEMVDIVALDRALDELIAMDERLCRVVELKFFAGLTNDECAEVLRVSRATVERDWSVAKTWLYERLVGPR